MASSKEIQQSSRPISQQRPSLSGSLPRPVGHSRNHSHSVLSGSLVPPHKVPHRVTRRKSVTSNNVAAIVAAVTEAGNTPPMPISTRWNLSKNRSAMSGSLPSPSPSLSSHEKSLKFEGSENAIDSDQNDDAEDESRVDVGKSRARPANEGGYIVKENGKKGNGGDLKCDKCGKNYKHSSCLAKHLWEHTPEWSYTSKLLISKHQQVQLLEAASVLVTMNQGGVTPPASAMDFDSDNYDGSASPTSSSEQQDIIGSADTTPPPESVIYSQSYRTKRYSNGSGHSGYSRSYQSAPSANLYGSSIPSTYSHSRQHSHERRPTSSGVSQNREDDGLAAAVELLSCSFGSAGQARLTPVSLLADAPPVPNIPAYYLRQDSYGSVMTPSLHPRQTESYTRHQASEGADVGMNESAPNSMDDGYYDTGPRDRSDEDDEGVFGRMEE